MRLKGKFNLHQHWPKILTVTQENNKNNNNKQQNAFIIICGPNKSTERQKIAQESLETGAKEAQEIKSALGITMFLKRVQIPLGEKYETSPLPSTGPLCSRSSCLREPQA